MEKIRRPRAEYLRRTASFKTPGLALPLIALDWDWSGSDKIEMTSKRPFVYERLNDVIGS